MRDVTTMRDVNTSETRAALGLRLGVQKQRTRTENRTEYRVQKQSLQRISLSPSLSPDVIPRPPCLPPPAYSWLRYVAGLASVPDGCHNTTLRSRPNSLEPTLGIRPLPKAMMWIA